MAEASALFLLSNYIEKSGWNDAEAPHSYVLSTDVVHRQAIIDPQDHNVHVRSGELGGSDVDTPARSLARNGDLRAGRELHRRLTTSISRVARRHLNSEHPASPAGTTSDMPAFGASPAQYGPQYGAVLDMVLESAGTSLATPASLQDFLLKTAPLEEQPSTPQVVLPAPLPHQPQSGAAGQGAMSLQAGSSRLSRESFWRGPSPSFRSRESGGPVGRRSLQRFPTALERSLATLTSPTQPIAQGALDDIADVANMNVTGTGTAAEVRTLGRVLNDEPPRDLMTLGGTAGHLPRQSSRTLRPNTSRSASGRGNAGQSVELSALPWPSTPEPGTASVFSDSPSPLPKRLTLCTDPSARPRTLPLPSRPQQMLDGAVDPEAQVGGGGWTDSCVGMYSAASTGEGNRDAMLLSCSLRRRRRRVEGFSCDADADASAEDLYSTPETAAAMISAASATAAAATRLIRKVSLNQPSVSGAGHGGMYSSIGLNPSFWFRGLDPRSSRRVLWDGHTHRSRTWMCVGNDPRVSGFRARLLTLLSLYPWDIVDKWLPALMPSPWRTAWDALLLVLLLYTAVVVPLEVGFPNVANGILVKLHIVVMVIFWLDVIVQFRTAYVSLTGELVRDSRQMAAHYCRTWFLVDLVSAIPWAELLQVVLSTDGHSLAGQLLALARMPRLLRLLRVIRLLDRLRYANTLRIVRLMVLLMLIAHWTACTWHGMAEWIPGWPWLFSELLVSDSLLLHYSVAVYYAYVLVIGSDNPSPAPQNNLERVFMIIMLVTGSMMSALVVSHMAMLVVNYNSLSSRYLTKASLASDVLRYFGAPDEHQIRVADYYDFLIQNDHPGPEADGVLHELPRGLLADIKWSLYSTALNSLPLFLGCDEPFMAALQSRLTLSAYTTSEVIFRAHDTGRDMFIVRQGCVVLKSVLGEVSALLKAGDMFGELALLPDLGARRRTHTAIAMGPTDVIALGARDLAVVSKDHPQSGDIVQERLLQRFQLLLNGGMLLGLNEDGSSGLSGAFDFNDLDGWLQRTASEPALLEPAAEGSSNATQALGTATRAALTAGAVHGKGDDCTTGNIDAGVSNNDDQELRAIIQAFGDSTEGPCGDRGGGDGRGDGDGDGSSSGLDSPGLPSRGSSSSSWTSFLEAANSRSVSKTAPRIPAIKAENSAGFRSATAWRSPERSQTTIANAAAGGSDGGTTVERTISPVKRSGSSGRRAAGVENVGDEENVGGGRIGSAIAAGSAAAIVRTAVLEPLQLDTLSTAEHLEAPTDTTAVPAASINTAAAAVAVAALAASRRRSVSLRRRGEGSSRLANASGPVGSDDNAVATQFAIGTDADLGERDLVGGWSVRQGNKITSRYERTTSTATAGLMMASPDEISDAGSRSEQMAGLTSAAGRSSSEGSPSSSEAAIEAASTSLPPPAPPTAPLPPAPPPSPPTPLQYPLHSIGDGDGGGGGGLGLAAGAATANSMAKQPFASPFSVHSTNGFAAIDSEEESPPELAAVQPAKRSLLGFASLLRRFNATTDGSGRDETTVAATANGGYGHNGSAGGATGLRTSASVPVNPTSGGATVGSAGNVSSGGSDAAAGNEDRRAGSGATDSVYGTRRLYRHTSGGRGRSAVHNGRTGGTSRNARGNGEAGSGAGLLDSFMSTAPAWVIARASRDHGHRRQVLTEEMVGRALQTLALALDAERDLATTNAPEQGGPQQLSAGHMNMLLGLVNSVVRRIGVDALPAVRDAVRARVRRAEEHLAVQLQAMLGSLIQIEKEVGDLDESAAAAKRRLASIENAAAEAAGDGVLVPNLMGLLDTDTGLNLAVQRLQQAAVSENSIISDPLLASALQSLGGFAATGVQQPTTAAAGAAGRQGSIIRHCSHSSATSEMLGPSAERNLSPTPSEKRVSRRSSLNLGSTSLSGIAAENRQSPASGVLGNPVRSNTGVSLAYARRRSMDSSSQMLLQLRKNDFTGVSAAGGEEGSAPELQGSGTQGRSTLTDRRRTAVSTSDAVSTEGEATAAGAAATGAGAITAASTVSQIEELKAVLDASAPMSASPAMAAAPIATSKSRRMSATGQLMAGVPAGIWPRTNTSSQVLPPAPRQRPAGGAARNAVLDDSIVCDAGCGASSRLPQPTLLPSERPGARRSPGRNPEQPPAVGTNGTLEQSLSGAGGPHRPVLRRGSTITILNAQPAGLSSSGLLSQLSAGGGSGTQQQQQQVLTGRTAASRAAAAAAAVAAACPAGETEASRTVGNGGSYSMLKLRSGSELPFGGSEVAGVVGAVDGGNANGRSVRQGQVSDDFSVRAGPRIGDDLSVRGGLRVGEDVSVRAGRRAGDDVSVRGGRRAGDDVSVRGGRRAGEDVSVRAGR